MNEQPDVSDATKTGIVEWDTIPAFVVKNVTTWVNPELQPMPIELGKETSLAMALRFGDDTKTPFDMWLGRRYGHNRSVDISAAYFKDPDGRIYRDVDGKGNGYILRSSRRVSLWQTDPKQGDVIGLLDEKWARHDAEIAETFTKLGMRTHRVLCVAKLHELPVLGEDGVVRLIPIEQIPRGKPTERKHGILPEGFEPAIAIRAFGTKTRISDVVQALGPYAPIREKKEEDKSRDAIEDAIQLVNREYPEVTDIESYAHWFAKTLGRNVGIMHGAGYIHNFLSPHNISLDCRLLDFDSVIRPDQSTDEGWGKYMKELKDDMVYVHKSLDDFMSELFILYKHKLFKQNDRTSWIAEAKQTFDKEYGQALATKE